MYVEWFSPVYIYQCYIPTFVFSSYIAYFRTQISNLVSENILFLHLLKGIALFEFRCDQLFILFTTFLMYKSCGAGCGGDRGTWAGQGDRVARKTSSRRKAATSFFNFSFALLSVSLSWFHPSGFIYPWKYNLIRANWVFINWAGADGGWQWVAVATKPDRIPLPWPRPTPAVSCSKSI